MSSPSTTSANRSKLPVVLEIAFFLSLAALLCSLPIPGGSSNDQSAAPADHVSR